jgi:hypothetical protein
LGRERKKYNDEGLNIPKQLITAIDSKEIKDYLNKKLDIKIGTIKKTPRNLLELTTEEEKELGFNDGYLNGWKKDENGEYKRGRYFKKIKGNMSIEDFEDFESEFDENEDEESFEKRWNLKNKIMGKKLKNIYENFKEKSKKNPEILSDYLLFKEKYEECLTPEGEYLDLDFWNEEKDKSIPTSEDLIELCFMGNRN